MSDIDTKIKEAKEAKESNFPDPYVYRQNSVNVYVHGALLQAKALIPSIKKNKKVEFGKTNGLRLFPNDPHHTKCSK